MNDRSPQALSLSLVATVGCGAGLGVAGAYAPILGGAAFGALSLTLLALLSRYGWAAAALLILAAVPVVIGLTIGAAGVDAPRYAGSVDEISMVAGWVLLLALWPTLDRDVRRAGALALSLFLLSELVGYVSAVGDIQLRVAAAWQDLRWLGIVGWGIAIASRVGAARMTRVALRLLLAWGALNLVMVLQQIVTGDVGTAGARLFGIPTTEGAFGHPTGGALVGTSLVLLAGMDRIRAPAARALQNREAWSAIALGILIIVLSTRFKPLLGVAAAAVVVLAYTRMRSVVFAAAVVPVAVGAVTMVIAFTGSIGAGTNASVTGNLLEASTSNAPTRLALVRGANVLAKENAPLGRGLGTFGSDLSPNEEQRAFDRANLGATYGFTYGTSQYRQDSYVGHVLAERGYFGFLLWILALAATTFTAMRWNRNDLYPACAVAVMVAMATVGPSLHSVQYSLLVLLPAAFALASPPVARNHPSAPEATP